MNLAQYSETFTYYSSIDYLLSKACQLGGNVSIAWYRLFSLVSASSIGNKQSNP